VPDVLLVTPPSRRGQSGPEAEENLGLAFVASALRREGISAEILDANLEGWTLSRTIREIETRTFKAIGLSMVFSPLVKSGRELLYAVGSLQSPARQFVTAAGGHVPSLAYHLMLRDTCPPDLIVRGEGERAFPEVMKKILGNQDWRNVPGVAYLGEGGVACTPPGPLIEDLDNLAPPAHDTLRKALAGGSRATIYSSRGCYGHCSFCSISAFYGLSPGQKWRAMSAEPTVDEVERLVKDYGAANVFFTDDNFIGPGRAGRERAAAVAEEVLSRGLKVALNISIRANDVDRPVLELLKRAGLRQVFIGVESGAQSALDRYQKGVTVEQNREALRTLIDLGLEPVLGFIIFDPYSTLSEIAASMEFLGDAQLARVKLNARLDARNRLEAYEGTPIVDRLREEGRLSGDYVDYHYSFRDPLVGLLHWVLSSARSLTAPVRALSWRLGRPK
jgi:radical SAM superfamily enzyme YgiQ (UPF0313 family)